MRDRFGGLVGASAAMSATFTLLERAAASDATVLLEGEAGTGKEAAARALHDAGARRGGPFVVVHCAAVNGSSGPFERAAGGTLFLDEVAELPLEVQPKLLRALERRDVQRVVAATNGDLGALVQRGGFRGDVYYRLVLRIALPPLRERPEDIPLICAHLLEVLGAEPQLAARLPMDDLVRARWPGNVRELRNHLERCVVFGGPVPVEPAVAGDGDELALPLRAARERMTTRFERRYLAAALARHGQNVSAAARAAGVDRAYFHRLLVRHGLRTPARARVE